MYDNVSRKDIALGGNIMSEISHILEMPIIENLFISISVSSHTSVSPVPTSECDGI